MALPSEYQQIIDKLFSIYKLKGFIHEDESLKILSENSVSFRDTDRLIGILLSKGVIFSSNNTLVENDFYDYGFTDYDKVFSEIIDIDKNLTFTINYIKKIKPPQRHEFDNLYTQAISGNSFAKKRILEMYMRQAVRQALFFSKKYLNPLSDCIQEAFIGLIIGFEKYNPNRSQKFPIHILWWIRQMLYRKIALGNDFFTFPVHIKEKQFKIYKIFKNKSQSDLIKNKKNVLQYIKNHLLCSKSKAVFYYKTFLKNIDIDEIILSDDNGIINDLNQNITNYYLKGQILEILSTIPTRESEILLMRFGINNEKEWTLDEVGEIFNVTRERIRQIEAKALRRLRHPKRARKLAKFLPDYNVRELSDNNLPKNEKFLE